MAESLPLSENGTFEEEKESSKSPMDKVQSSAVGIRPSVDGLCRDGPSEISRDPSTKRLQTRPKRLGWF